MDIMNDGDDDRKAGSLILRDLKLFNEATIFMKEKFIKTCFSKLRVSSSAWQSLPNGIGIAKQKEQ